MAMKEATETAYAFKYLRADRKEVERGPFLTKREANGARNEMKKAGAIVTDVYPTNGNAEQMEILNAQKDGYAKGLVKAFEIYLRRELEVLDADIGYKIIYYYIDELVTRVKRYVKEHNPAPTKKAKAKDMPRELIKKFTQYGKVYLKGVAGVFQEMSEHYSPMDGSVPEDISETLKKLSREFSQAK